MAITQKVFTSRSNNLDSATYVGEVGRLFYEQPGVIGVAPVLKYSDGSTPGGLPLSGSSLTFSGSTPPDNPHDGLLWWDTVDGRLYIYYEGTWVDASPEANSTGTVLPSNVSYFNNDIGYLTSGTVNQYVQSFTVTNVSYFNNDIGYLTSSTLSAYLPYDNDNYYTTTATVNILIANSLTGYATQLYVTSRGYITTASLSVTTLASGTNALTYNNGVFTFTPSNLSSYATQTWVENHNYLTAGEGMTALNATPNQTVVQDLGSGVWRVGTVQDIGTTSTVRFGDLTVNNISVLGTSTNLISNVVQGYRLYLASSATNLSQINGGGIQLGNTSTGVHSIFWNSSGYWDTDGDGLTTLTLNATTSTLNTLRVTTQARFGYVNHDLTLANAYIQVDASADTFREIAIVNHYTGTNASSDFVATNDIGDDNNHYIDMGINSSIYTGSDLGWTINGANDGYLYVNQGSIAIGTDTPGKDVVFFTGGVDSSNIVATVSSSSINVNSINALTSSTLSLNLDNNGSVSVNTLQIPVGTILGSNTSTIYTLAQLTLTNVVAYSTLTTDTLVTGEYGLLNGVPAPYAVYEFTQTPDPALQVGDLLSGSGIPNILPGTSAGFTGTVVLSVGTGTWSNYVVGYSDYSVLPPPTPGIAVLIGRNTLNANLAITTQPITDIGLFPGVVGNIVAGGSIIPLVNDTYDLGSPGKRWRHVWVGAGTIYILDETLGTDVAVGARDGLVYLQGGVGLNVGEFTLIDNQIKIADSTRDILIGVTTATGKVIFNRPITVNTPAGNATFSVDRLGLTKINPPTSLASTQSALSIVGNASGLQQPRNFNDTMLQITGADNTSTRVSMDAFGTGVYPVIAGRQAGGTVASPSRTVNGDTLFRISTQGWGDTGYVSAIGRIQVQALQDFTNAAAGTRVRFQLTPLNTTTIQTITADITATGLSFVGNPLGGITFRDTSRQITAWNTSTAVWYQQIVNPPAPFNTGTLVAHAVLADTATTATNAGYAYSFNTATLVAHAVLADYVVGGIGVASITTGTGIRVNNSTGTVQISFANDGNYITTSSLTVSTLSSGTSSLSYNNGVFAFTPPNLSSYATQNYVLSQGYTTTATVNSLIANSLTNYATQTYVTTRGYITTASLSVTQNSPAATGSLSYNNGIFTFTPTAPFSTSTLVANAVTANTLAGGYVSSITAGTGTVVSTSTGAVTIWALPAQAITTTGTTTASNYTLDLSGPTFVHWQPSANGNRTITLTGFIPGRKVELWITPHATNDIFTVTGVTGSQCSNGHNTFTMNGVGASQQSSFIMQFYCTTDTIGGVWIYGNGSL